MNLSFLFSDEEDVFLIFFNVVSFPLVNFQGYCLQEHFKYEKKPEQTGKCHINMELVKFHLLAVRDLICADSLQLDTAWGNLQECILFQACIFKLEQFCYWKQSAVSIYLFIYSDEKMIRILIKPHLEFFYFSALFIYFDADKCYGMLVPREQSFLLLCCIS